MNMLKIARQKKRDARITFGHLSQGKVTTLTARGASPRYQGQRVFPGHSRVLLRSASETGGGLPRGSQEGQGQRLAPTYSVARHTQEATCTRTPSGFLESLRFVLLVISGLGTRKTRPASHRDFTHHVSSARRGRLPPRSRRSASPHSADRVLRPLRVRMGSSSPRRKQQVVSRYRCSVSNFCIAHELSMSTEPNGSSRPHMQVNLSLLETGFGRVRCVANISVHSGRNYINLEIKKTQPLTVFLRNIQEVVFLCKKHNHVPSSAILSQSYTFCGIFIVIEVMLFRENMAPQYFKKS